MQRRLNASNCSPFFDRADASTCIMYYQAKSKFLNKNDQELMKYKDLDINLPRTICAFHFNEGTIYTFLSSVQPVGVLHRV